MFYEIATLIKETRKAKKITQAQLAKALGMSPATISNIENNSINEIGIRKILSIMHYLGLELIPTAIKKYDYNEMLAASEKERAELAKQPDNQKTRREKWPGLYQD